MDVFGSIELALDFAIESEQEAVDFYGTLAAQSGSSALREMLLSFAKIEQGHKEKLLAAKSDETLLSEYGSKPVVDLKISDYLVAAEAGPDMSLQDALVVAMKREKVAMQLYTNLAEIAEISSMPVLQELFEKLAQEEGGHKHSFENLYEERFLPEN